MPLFVICLFGGAGGIALGLLGRLFRSYFLAALGLLLMLVSGGLALIVDERVLLGILWIVFSILSVTFAVLWLYKNKRWAFWWSFGADMALIASAYFSSFKMEGASDKDLLTGLLIPVAIFVLCGVLFNFVFNFLVPKLTHKDRNEIKHLTNVDPLIGKKITIIQDPANGRSARGLIGDVDWAVEPFFPGDKNFKVGDVVKIHKIKGVTLLAVRDGSDFRKEMKETRKAEAEAYKQKKEEEKAKKAAEKAAEKAAPAEEPAPVEEPAPAPVVEEPAPVVEEPAPVVEEPAPVEEPVAEPVVEEPAPVVEEQPAVEEPVPEPAKKEKAEFIPFSVRLKASDDFLKESYNELKSEVLSYGIKSRVSSTGDAFRLHTKTYVKMVVAGKYLKLYFALNPEDYKDSTYPFEDASRMGAHKDTPFVFKIKSGLSVRRAKALIADCAGKDGLTQGEVVKHDHIADIE